MMRAKRISVRKNQHTLDHGEEDKEKVVINSLDYDVLAQIIMWLPIVDRINMEEVCVKWKEACKLAWYDIKKSKCESSIGRSHDNRLLTPSYLKKMLLRCGRYLKELSLSQHATYSIMPLIGDHCQNLTHLECELHISNFAYSTDKLIQVLTQLNKLKYIRIKTITHGRPEIFDLFAITNSLPEEINEIHLISSPWIIEDTKVSIAFQKFRNLQKLTLHGKSILDNMSLQEIAEKTTLVYLNIQLHKITDEFFLFDKLVNLEYIDLTLQAPGISGLRDNILSTNVLHSIFRTCKNLKHLDIPSGLYGIAELPRNEWINLQNLEYLGFSSDVMLRSVYTIVEYCSYLKHLKIHHPRSRHSVDSSALEILTKLKNLESLVWLSPIRLREQSIIAISKNCKKLKRLEIPSLTVELLINIDEEPTTSYSVLDEFSKLQYLEHLNLCDVRNLSDSTIIAIAKKCRHLKHLDIRNCISITETALIALTNLKNLQKLYVTGLDITAKTMNHLQGLKEFYFSLNPELDIFVIGAFIQSNPDLEKLYIKGKGDKNLVIVADWATENRTNGIILDMGIAPWPRRTPFVRPKIESRWLEVTFMMGYV